MAGELVPIARKSGEQLTAWNIPQPEHRHSHLLNEE